MKRLVVFQIGAFLCGIDIEFMKAIIENQVVRSVPNTEPCIIGITTIHNNVVPVYNLQKRFNIETEQCRRSDCMILVNCGDEMLAFGVDKIEYIKDVPVENIFEVPVVVRNKESEYIEKIVRIENKLIFLLSPSSFC